MPVTPNVVPIVAELLTVSALTVALPVALSVLTIAIFPPADPNVPLCGPLNDTAATNELADIIFAPVMLPLVPDVDILPAMILPTTPNVVPMVAELLTVNELTVLFPLTLSLVKIAVLGVTLPIGVACIPPRALSVVIAVIEPLLVSADTVAFPLEPTDVNRAVLGVTLPIGVACSPPNADKEVIAVIDPLLVNAAAVIFPVALTVVN